MTIVVTATINNNAAALSTGSYSDTITFTNTGQRCWKYHPTGRPGRGRTYAHPWANAGIHWWHVEYRHLE